MKVYSLSAENFRSYDFIDWKPHGGYNFIKGLNGAGKTNLIEAVYFATTGRSFRTLNERELIKRMRSESTLRIDLSVRGKASNLLRKIKSEGGRKLIVNGVEQKKSPPEIIFPVSFCPEDLMMVKGSPQLRRRWIDSEAGVLSPDYYFYLSKYKRVLGQRNESLRLIREGRQPESSLEIWNGQLCFYGIKVIRQRVAFLSKAAPLIREYYSRLSMGKESLGLKYHCSANLGFPESEGESTAKFSEALFSLKKEELYRAQTMVGPHRDDVIFDINGAEARYFASQGQQRTLVLSVKLAQLELIKEEFKDTPILILDDVFLELDARRRDMFLNCLGHDMQLFITVVEMPPFAFDGMVDGQVFNVRDGKISKE